ncbi:MAG: nucleotidyltransferase domain-containing protein [Nanoarchaeota archaeon]
MIQKSSIWKTAEVFFSNPTKWHYLKNISKRINLAHTSVKQNLDKLINLGVIKENIEKKGKRIFPIYCANVHEYVFKKYKLIYNITSLIESDLAIFIEKKLSPKSVIVFGSYRRGEDTEDSDIDIFIECEKEEIDVAEFEKKLGRNIQLHFNKNLGSYPKELKNNIINGIVLSGFVEAYK